MSSLLLLLASSALATPTFSVTDLGSLGGPDSWAIGMNDQGQVVGWTTTSTTRDCEQQTRPCRTAFLWEQGAMVPLGILPGDEESVARAINEGGLVVGTSERGVIAGFGTFHGVSWSGQTPTALSDLGGGQSYVHDVNDAGTIVGWAPDPSALADRAVTWTQGGITAIGDTEPHTYNRATGVNNLGLVAGFGWNLFEPNDALLFDQGRWATIGGTDSPWQNAEAWDINDAGTVVGLQAFPSGAWHAAIWSRGTATDLGTVAGYDHSELYDVNERSEAVGASYASETERRGIYFDGVQLHDLNDLVPSTFTGTIVEASEINESGAIAATAFIGGTFHALLLEPAPSAEITSVLPGASGTTNTLSVEGMTPRERTWLVAGQTAGTTVVPGCPATTVDLDGPVVVARGRTDGNGAVTLSVDVPRTLSGQTVTMVAVQRDSCVVTEALSVTFR